MNEKISYPSISELARQLGVSRKTMYSRLDAYEIPYDTLEFTAEELKQLRQKPNKAPVPTPKQRHDNELLETKNNYESIITQLRIEHELELEKQRDSYREILNKQQMTFKRAITDIKKEYASFQKMSLDTHKQELKQLKADSKARLLLQREETEKLNENLEIEKREKEKLLTLCEKLTQIIDKNDKYKSKHYPRAFRY